MDNFKFMDSWPTWLRWVLVLPASAIIPGMYYVLSSSLLSNASLTLITLAIACFVWCGTATAPRFKLVVASVLGLTVLVEQYTEYLAALRERVIITPLTGPFNMDLILSRVFAPYVISGVAIAWSVILWGYLRRR